MLDSFYDDTTDDLSDFEAENGEELYEGFDGTSGVDVSTLQEEVGKYTNCNFDYPMIRIKEGFSCENYRMETIKKLLESGDGKDISIYWCQNSEVYRIGKIGGWQVDMFLDVVGEESIVCYLDKDVELKGSMIYTLQMMI